MRVGGLPRMPLFAHRPLRWTRDQGMPSRSGANGQSRRGDWEYASDMP